MRSHAPKARTRQALWNVKQEKPELFELEKRQEQQRRAAAAERERADDGPSGFGKSIWEGWLHHPGQNVYRHEQTGRQCWLDPTTNELSDLNIGESLSLTCTSGAAIRSCGASVASCTPRTGGSSSSSASVPKHVIIPDLHRAAQALKVELNHLDRPAAMVALFGAPPAGASGGKDVGLVARAFHEKLMKRLAAFRGKWAETALRAAITQTLEDIAKAEGEARFSAGIVLVTGRQAVAVVMAPGAHVCIAGGIASAECIPTADQASEQDKTVKSVHLRSPDDPGATSLEDELSVVLLLGQVDPSRLTDESLLAAAVPHMELGRSRAASMAALQVVHAQGATGQLAAACVRLSGTGFAMPLEMEQAAKRQKLDAAPSKVRVRQVVLLHWKGTGAQPTNPVKRKAVKRTPDEAEAQLLTVLDGLVADPSTFSSVCKAISECQSALKGGELTGDLGWLDRSPDTIKEGEKARSTSVTAIKSVVPAPLRRAAFELEVGELSDLIPSEIGVHLLLRTA